LCSGLCGRSSVAGSSRVLLARIRRTEGLGQKWIVRLGSLPASAFTDCFARFAGNVTPRERAALRPASVRIGSVTFHKPAGNHVVARSNAENAVCFNELRTGRCNRFLFRRRAAFIRPNEALATVGGVLKEAPDLLARLPFGNPNVNVLFRKHS
jgi:hypothetical protein